MLAHTDAKRWEILEIPINCGEDQCELESVYESNAMHKVQKRIGIKDRAYDMSIPGDA